MHIVWGSIFLRGPLELCDYFTFLQAQQAAFETEQYKEENRELQNQLRLMSEEQETLTVQLEQTGHVLDEANTEIREKEEEIGRLQALLEGKDHEIGDLKAKCRLPPSLPPLSLSLSPSLSPSNVSPHCSG